MSIASTPPSFHRRPWLHAVPERLPAVVRADLVPTLSGGPPRLRQPRPRRLHPGARARRAGRRVGDAHLLQRPPRHRLAQQGHERALRGRPRGGRPLRRRPPRRRRRLHPQHHRRVNLLARSLPRDTSVVVFSSEHHASLLPWRARDTVRLPVPATERDAEALLEDALRHLPRGTARRPRQALVVLTSASNVTGELWPVERLAAIARRHGARVLLDAAQSAAHRTIDLGALDVDWVAFSGHKLHAPYGTGVLAGRSDWLDAAAPYLAGGGATRRHRDRDPLDLRRRPPRGRQPERHRRRRAGRRLRHDPRAPRRHRRPRGAPHRGPAHRPARGSRASRPTRSSATTTSAAPSSPSPSTASTATSSPPPSRPTRHRGARRQVLRPPPRRRPARGGRRGRAAHHRSPRQRRHRDDPGARRAAAAAVAQLATEGPGTEYVEVDGEGWVPVDDPRELDVALPW